MTAKRAIIFNFDGTMADTFNPSARNISTLSAYDDAIKTVLGTNAFNRYREQGGLLNRAPSQVIIDLGVPDDEIAESTDALVQKKLEYLVPEIGTPAADGSTWPNLTLGFLDFWAVAQKLVDRGELELANISSGHRDFILRTYEVHGLEPPSVLITHDDIRSTHDISRRKSSNLPDPIMLIDAARQIGIKDMNKVVYVGDDATKDGQMALAAGVAFVHFDPELGSRLEVVDEPDIVIFHAGTKLDNGKIMTSGGRVLGVSATGPTLHNARAKAYGATKRVQFEGMQFRTDIGSKSL